ncbi:MAG: hypothetical protein EXR50_02115 [Dehalococcoidia bacterium]|nr:hypothetical protein [Dehalococcoidia bacterium]
MEAARLIDTGADSTILAPRDDTRLAQRFGISLNTLPGGNPTTGVGGQTRTRVIEAIITLNTFTIPLTLTILVPPPGAPLPPIPSLLVRDILSHFALFMEDRTDRVLLLKPQEADALNLP